MATLPAVLPFLLSDSPPVTASGTLTVAYTSRTLTVAYVPRTFTPAAVGRTMFIAAEGNQA